MIRRGVTSQKKKTVRPDPDLADAPRLPVWFRKVEGAAESHPHGRCEVKRYDDRIALLMEGYHHIDDARRATVNFSRYAKAIDGPFELIVDLGRLDSYSRDSRLHWLPVLKEHAKSIRCLSLVGGSGLLRMTASAICLYAGLRMRTARSLKEALATPG